ncbi:NUDIX domain-containing protein [Streptomyces sp. NBC_01795]|uniref:NUDIX domain-containing protein n=1 Tax=unclassified Streptomyces TaxID=2593676 RepID=UPI002DD9CDE5|nr:MULTISPECIES: NUDIX domain-containing protein [unclassified Streptomyces]WSA94457.1 NUDIX domain-containing protein [Streptomyces sp. NBC_01795]WSB78876.1 NUDIX domain-containing protein [Streptomyces sp. NBC_01775]
MNSTSTSTSSSTNTTSTSPGTAPSERPRDRALTAPTVSCVFVCHDGAGRILLARRSAGARDEPGSWDTGAGALEHGETFEEAVRREVREEYATEARTIETLGVRNILRGTPVSHWVAVVFAVEVDPGRVAIGEPHKFDALGWFTPDELPEPPHSQLAETLALLPARGRWAGR